MAVSDEIRSVLLSVGVNERNVRLIRNGIVLQDYDQAPVAHDEICILNVGRLTAQKAQHDLIAAAGLMKQAGVRAKIVVIAGEGSYASPDASDRGVPVCRTPSS